MLWALLQRLSSSERCVIKLIVELIQQEPFDPLSGFECHLEELLDWAARYSAKMTVDYDNLMKGIDSLSEREWIERKNTDAKVFRFKLGILLLCLRYRYIILDHVEW